MIYQRDDVLGVGSGSLQHAVLWFFASWGLTNISNPYCPNTKPLFFMELPILMKAQKKQKIAATGKPGYVSTTV